MTKKLLQYRNSFMAILVAEFALAIAFYSIIQNDALLVLCGYIFVKNILLLIAIVFLYNRIEEDRLEVKTILNEDASNIYLFGGIGVICYDDKKDIEWTSDIFNELDEKIVGKNLLTWQPRLERLFVEETIETIEIHHRIFEVYNHHEHHLLYLKDVSEYRYLKRDYLRREPVLAYLTVDNYDEVINSVDQQKSVLIQSKIRQMIFDWAENYHMIIRRYKSDGYILFFTEEIYHHLAEDKFDILDKIKNQAKEFDVFLTVSLGVARQSEHVHELDEKATSALTLAYSRGGDQVVVKSKEDAIRFFGGTSEAYEKNNKVRARVIAASLVSLIKAADNVLIMGHTESDLDSLGASIAMYRVCQAYGIEAQVVINPESLEEKTKKIYQNLKTIDEYKNMFISVSRIEESIYMRTLLIAVDHHRPSLSIAPLLLDQVKDIVVIDHHRRGEEFVKSPILTYLEPSASSTVELIVEIYDYMDRRIRLNETDATIMYAGMLIDTNSFKSRVGVRTFEAAAQLKDRQANIALAYEYLQDDYETTQAKMSIMHHAYPLNDQILIAYGDDEEIYSRTTLAKAGNELIGISGILAVFTLAKINKTDIAISARSIAEINVQVIMESLGGGGHFGMAACQLKETSLLQAIEMLEEKIKEYLEERTD